MAGPAPLTKVRGVAANTGEETMTRLEELEDRSVYIIREAYKNLDNLCMLWSMGKDSTVLLWLVRKAFFGHCPIPLVHIDTSYKIPEMISYRDAMAKEWGLDLVVARNGQALDEGMHPSRGTFLCCSALKTEALKQLLAQKGYTGVIVGVRSDEEGTRAKERYFSPRDSNNDWDFREQPPELWDQFKTRFEPGTHLRVHPLLDWSELDIWEYIEAEGIPVTPLYFERGAGRRYRSLGCAPCTGTIASSARTVAAIVEELRCTRQAERSGRAQDADRGMERLRKDGYM